MARGGTITLKVTALRIVNRTVSSVPRRYYWQYRKTEHTLPCQPNLAHFDSFAAAATARRLEQNFGRDFEREGAARGGVEPRDTARCKASGHAAAAQDQAARERAAVRATAGGQGEVEPFLAPGRPER